MPDTKPLKMCVKLARDIGDDCCHGWEAEWDGTTAAKLIDARIRPLIEALKMAHDACNGLWNNPINALPEIEAALKSAGAE